MIMAISHRHGYFQSMCVRLKDEISNNNHYTYEIINVSVSLRSGLNESQVIFNWIKEVK